MTKKRVSDARIKLLNDISDLASGLGKLQKKRDTLSERIRVTEPKLWGLKELLLRDDLADNYGKPVICNKANECGAFSCPHGRIHTCDGTCIRYCFLSEEQGLNGETCIPVTKPNQRKQSMAEYNGHPSYNAWNVSLWLNNDEGLYRMMVDAVRTNQNRRAAAEQVLDCLKECCGEYPKTPDGVPYTITNIIRAMVEL